MQRDQTAASRSARIKELAKKLGFFAIGISRAEQLQPEARRLETWLKEGRHGTMNWMEDHFDMRTDPRILVPGARSVVSMLLNYHNPTQPADPTAPRISSYAYGADYHKVIRKKLKELIKQIRTEVGEIDGRVFVDSAPVMDKAWAQRAGLGWIGKHSNLINPKLGSWFFIAELIIDLELEPDAPIADHCGTCTRCIDACPTQAIIQPYIVDGSKCISYFTIEYKGELPLNYRGKFGNWIFGCDVCQQVCPWNRFAQPHAEPALNPPPELLQMSYEGWLDLSEEVFNQLFERSPLKRTKFEGLRRNIRFIKKPQD